PGGAGAAVRTAAARCAGACHEAATPLTLASNCDRTSDGVQYDEAAAGTGDVSRPTAGGCGETATSAGGGVADGDGCRNCEGMTASGVTSGCGRSRVEEGGGEVDCCTAAGDGNCW